MQQHEEILHKDRLHTTSEVQREFACFWQACDCLLVSTLRKWGNVFQSTKRPSLAEKLFPFTSSTAPSSSRSRNNPNSFNQFHTSAAALTTSNKT